MQSAGRVMHVQIRLAGRIVPLVVLQWWIECCKRCRDIKWRSCSKPWCAAEWRTHQGHGPECVRPHQRAASGDEGPKVVANHGGHLRQAQGAQ